MTGTLIRCSCCARGEHVAYANLVSGEVSFRKDVHGRKHSLTMALSDLVQLLDPKGTSFTAVR